MRFITEQVLSGLVSPVGLAPHPVVAGVSYLLDQPGMIWEIGQQARPWSDLTSIVLQGEGYNERGLLGFAWHPAADGRCYIFYSSTPEHAIQLQRQGLAPEPRPGRVSRVGESVGGAPMYVNLLSEFQTNTEATLDLASERPLLAFPKFTPIHNGGSIGFGPDGLLYIGVGDGGPIKPTYAASDVNDLDGKILRIDVDVDPYGTPDPVFPDGQPEVYAIGFRNPWGLSWDEVGHLFVADAGADQRESVDLVIAGGNYGWPDFEGTLVTEYARKALREPLVAPIYEYPHESWLGGEGPFGVCVVGGYNTSDGRYIFGDFSGKVFVIEDRGVWIKTFEQDLPKGTYLKAVKCDTAGNGYLLCSREIGTDGNSGSLERIVWAG